MRRTGDLVILTMILSAVPMAVAGNAVVTERVYSCHPDEHGRLSGGIVEVPAGDFDGQPLGGGASFQTIVDNGPPSNRVDLVTIGDGYLISELDTYAAHTENLVNQFFAGEPFRTYAPLFNVHRVNVVSNESGVDNDPLGVERDTALNMTFWCSGIQRLLCVSTGLADFFAQQAPEVDQILAIANSTTYGGAGYASADIATLSGANASSVEVAIHELGHSLGNLADEYDYSDGTTYTGGERFEANISILEAAAMLSAESKWYRWLGESFPAAGGFHGTYEGAYYAEFGMNRPTSNSKMRTLGHPFNMPSLERLIIEIYRQVDPIDATTPSEGIVGRDEVLTIDTVDPIGHDLDVRWTFDGNPIPGGTTSSLDLASIDMTLHAHVVSVTVVDGTDMVRDETARSNFMTSTRSWTIESQTSPGDVNGDGAVDFGDVLAVLTSWGQCTGFCPGDITGTGDVNELDLRAVIQIWLQG